MANLVILDTGPLVAVMNRSDKFHQWAIDELSRVACPVVTCEPVLSEASFLVGGIDPGYRRLGEVVESKLVELKFDLTAHLSGVFSLLNKYRDTPMSLADACLVRMSELYDKATVMTIDSDFRHYRRNGRQVIPLIYPEARR